MGAVAPSTSAGRAARGRRLGARRPRPSCPSIADPAAGIRRDATPARAGSAARRWWSVAPSRSSTRTKYRGLTKSDAPPMDDGIGESPVGVVDGVGEVHAPPSTASGGGSRAGRSRQANGPSGRAWLSAVHDHRAVGRGRAEVVAPDGVRRVAVGARVHDPGSPNAEHWTLSRSACPWPPLTGQPSGPTSKKSWCAPRCQPLDITAEPPSAKRREGLAAGGAGERASKAARPSAPEQPEKLGVRPLRGPGVVGAPEERRRPPRRRRAGRPGRDAGTRGRSQPPSASPIAGRPPSGRRTCEEVVEQALDPLPNGARRRLASPCRQHESVEADLRRIARVAGRLLEVDAVLPHLPARSARRGSPAPSRSHRRAARPVPEHVARVDEPEGLAREVRVGGEVGGQVALHVAGVGRQPGAERGAGASRSR